MIALCAKESPAVFHLTHPHVPLLLFIRPVSFLESIEILSWQARIVPWLLFYEVM
jgi:hypothetical protein